MKLHTKRPHEYLWLKSIRSSKSRITLSKIMTTESLYKILTKAKMKMNHMYIFIFFGDSFLLITGMQDFLAQLYLLPHPSGSWHSIKDTLQLEI